MELRPGYKLTEVGIVPKDWAVEILSSVLTTPIQNGVFNEPSRKGRGCKLLNVIDLYGSFPVDTQALEQFDATSSELLRFSLKRGDMFFTRSSLTPDGIAQCNIYGGDANEVIVFDCHIIRARPDSTKVDAFYLARYCTSHDARRYLVAHAKTTTMTTVDQSVIGNLPVALPPLPEQHAIAAALSDVDALLVGLDRFIDKKRDLKQAAMQQLLTGQIRLPGFHGEWETKRLDELGVWKGGMTPSMQNPSFWQGGDVPWISSGDVKGVQLTETANCVTAHAVKQRATSVVPANSIVLVTRSGILRNYLPIASNIRPMAINQDIKALIPDEAFCAAYILQTLIWSGDRILANCMKVGTTVESIEFRWLKSFSIGVPPLGEQSAIAAVLSDMDTELSALVARRDKTRLLKQAMMQELLTGKTRLVPSEVADV